MCNTNPWFWITAPSASPITFTDLQFGFALGAWRGEKGVVTDHDVID
jgi:hypothetical protein